MIEEGGDLDHYALFENATPHDIKYRTQQMLKAWNSSSKEELERKGAEFFEKRASGYKGYGVIKSFTGNQKQGLLPEKWDPEAHNVVIYCSSEDKFAAIGEQWKIQYMDLSSKVCGGFLNQARE